MWTARGVPTEKSMTLAAQLSDTLADLVTKNAASVVRIEAGCRGGSGIVWSDNRIVTAAHLLEGDTTVGLPDGRSVAAKLVGVDRSTDIALLELSETGLVAAPFADLTGTHVGHLTLSLARPGKTVRASLGMIGTLSHDAFRTRAGGKIDAWLQPDGGVPQGFSGSLLVDVHGRALGMNTAALVRGSALTIPTSTLKRVIDELSAHGRVRRGYLGVGVAPARLPDTVASQRTSRGAIVVVGLEPGGPAERAGLAIGDVVLSIDGAELESPRHLAAFLSDRVDVAQNVVVLRGGNEITLTVTTIARPA